MDAALHAVSMTQFLRNYKLLFKTFYINEYRHYVRMLTLNVIDNGLACDCGVCRVLIMKCHRFCMNFIS